MAKLTLADVKGGRAIPQRGDMVGDLVYRGGGPSDLENYQLVTRNGMDAGVPLIGSIYDHPENFQPPGTVAYGAGPDQGAPQPLPLSGVKMPMPDLPVRQPLSMPGSLPSAGLAQPDGSSGLAFTQDYATNPERYPITNLQSQPGASLIGSQYVQDMNDRLQRSAPDLAAAQMGQMSVPLINGRMVAGGAYSTSRGMYQGKHIRSKPTPRSIRMPQLL